MNRRIQTVFLAAILIVFCANICRAETVEDKNLPVWRNGWIRQDESTWYYGLLDGSFMKDGWRDINGRRYYFARDGRMETGLITLEGVLYYLDRREGMAHDQVREINGVPYIFDSQGAGTPDWPYKMPVTVPVESEKTELHRSVDAMADAVLEEILEDEMNERQKAEAIWHWVKDHMTYSGYSPVGDWVGAAYDGLRKRHGDCYTYFGTETMLLTRAGFPVIEVIRSRDNDHYWCLVKVDNGWYHFDACPTVTGGNIMLFTTAELAGGRSNEFDPSIYPPTP